MVTPSKKKKKAGEYFNTQKDKNSRENTSSNESTNPDIKINLDACFQQQNDKCISNPSTSAEWQRQCRKRKELAENLEDKDKKLATDAARKVRERKMETEQKKLDQKQHNAEAMRKSRIEENEEEKQKRQQTDAEAKRRSRIEENEEEKQKRQQTDAEAKRRSGIEENEEEKKKRQQPNAEVMKRTGTEEKVKKQTSQQSIEFPPDIDDHIMEKCLQNFIDETSNQGLEIVECAVCAEGTNEFEKFDIDDLPGSDILRFRSLDDINNDNDGILDKYMFLGLILSQGGIDEEGLIHCCLLCINYLRKNKLTPLSIANRFQIGKTPDILKDLTLPEKLLIALYRPKMYSTKLRSYAGPGTAQRGYKGNAITFPQDVVKIAETLRSNTEILLDHIKVAFLSLVSVTG